VFGELDTPYVSRLPDQWGINSAASSRSSFVFSGNGLALQQEGYFLLALIIEKVSGIPYAAFLQKNVFDPLRLANTGRPVCVVEGGGYESFPPILIPTARDEFFFRYEYAQVRFERDEGKIVRMVWQWARRFRY
jgi:hypothetical protein